MCWLRWLRTSTSNTYADLPVMPLDDTTGIRASGSSSASMHVVANPGRFWRRGIHEKFRKLVVVEPNQHLGLMDDHVMETAEHYCVVQ